jgi:hypothetical protein
MAEAYKVKQDVSLPKAIRPLYDGSVAKDGLELYQTEGRNYAAGSYVLAEDITPPLRKKAEDGELDHVLEPVDVNEAQEVLAEQRRASMVSTFVPEHATEAHALELAGHDVEESDSGEQLVPDVPVDQSTEQVLAGADEVPVEETTEAKSHASEPKSQAKPKKPASPRKGKVSG